ncbi:MAG: ABC transporter ATP-binding protein [Planctomycetota bacterium]
MSGPEPVIEARGVGLAYRDGPRQVTALHGIDLAVGRGERVALVGPSGSGKSSLLFVLGGLRPPTEGEVCLLGRPFLGTADATADVRRRHVGFLFQEPFLVPYLSVRENALAHVPTPEALERVEALAASIGIAHLLDERPHRLSGGERQRAGLLRALAAGPDLVLADEPTASLDHATGRAVLEALAEHARDAALVVATHDLSLLDAVHRVLRLADGRQVPG